MNSIKALLLFTVLSGSFAHADSHCLESYRVLRNRLAVATGLAPVVGLSGVVGSAGLALSYEYGGMVALKSSALAPVAEVAFSTVIPLAAVGTFVALETYTITKFTQANRAFRLMKDVFETGDGKMLRKFVRSIQKKRPEMTEEEIIGILKNADQDETLCTRNHRFLIRDLYLIPAMKRLVLNSSSLEADEEDSD